MLNKDQYLVPFLWTGSGLWSLQINEFIDVVLSNENNLKRIWLKAHHFIAALGYGDCSCSQSHIAKTTVGKRIVILQIKWVDK